MDTLNNRDFLTHITVLGWLYVLGYAIFLVLAACGFFLLPTLSVVVDDVDAQLVLGIVGPAFGVLMLLLAAPGLLAGYGLLRRKPWARVLAMIIAVLGLVNFPLGTVTGVYALFVLTQPAAIAYFEPRRIGLAGFVGF